jgi:hypothetical protein
MRAVGARQRGHDPRRSPDRQPTLAHGIEQGLGQGLEQGQASTDPTDIATDPPGQLAQGIALGQRVQQGRLFDHLPTTLGAFGQTQQQCFIDRTVPGIDPDPILADLM